MKSLGNKERIRYLINIYKILISKPGIKKPLGKPTYRCEDNIQKDLKNTLRGYRKKLNSYQWWIFVNTVINFQVS